MTCMEVRGRLVEHSLGLLSPVDARSVERHLEWCAGCRKESAELLEGAGLVALSLPTLDPPVSLESKVVRRIALAAGTGVIPSRKRMRMLVAATLAAVAVAIGAVGWAVAERHRIEDIQASTTERLGQIQRLGELEGSLGGNPFGAELFPILDVRGSGRVVILSSPREDDVIIARVAILDRAGQAFTIEVKDDLGKVLSAGALAETNNGDLLFYELSGKNLSKGTSVTVLDGSGRPVLNGMVKPSAER
jgi:hypothetical protein